MAVSPDAFRLIGKWPCGQCRPDVEFGRMPMKANKKKRVARPRVLWQVNPTTRVVGSAKRYLRRTEKSDIRKTSDEEQDR